MYHHSFSKFQPTPLHPPTHLGVDLHGEEQPEVGMRSDGVQFLLQRDKPLRSKMDILEQHPPAQVNTIALQKGTTNLLNAIINNKGAYTHTMYMYKYMCI